MTSAVTAVPGGQWAPAAGGPGGRTTSNARWIWPVS